MFIDHYSLNIGPSTKMVIFKIDLRQIYIIVTFEPSSYLYRGWDNSLINMKGFRMKMKGSMKYTFHFGFKPAGILENTFHPLPTDWVVWGSYPPSPYLSQYKHEQGVNNTYH